MARSGAGARCGIINSVGENVLPAKYDEITYLGVFPGLLPHLSVEENTVSQKNTNSSVTTGQGDNTVPSRTDMHLFLVSQARGGLSQGLFSPEAGWLLPITYGQEIRPLLPPGQSVAVYEVRRHAPDPLSQPDDMRGLFAIGSLFVKAPTGWLVPLASGMSFEHIRNHTFVVTANDGGWRRSVGVLHTDKGWLMPMAPALGFRRLSEELLQILPDVTRNQSENSERPAPPAKGQLVTLCHTENGLLLADMPCDLMQASEDSSACVIRNHGEYGVFSPNRGWVRPMSPLRGGQAAPVFLDVRTGIVNLGNRLYSHGVMYPVPEQTAAVSVQNEVMLIAKTIVQAAQPAPQADVFPENGPTAHAATRLDSGAQPSVSDKPIHKEPLRPDFQYGLASLNGKLIVTPQYLSLQHVVGTPNLWLGSSPLFAAQEGTGVLPQTVDAAGAPGASSEAPLLQNDIYDASGAFVASFLSSELPQVQSGVIRFTNKGLQRFLTVEDASRLHSPYRITIMGSTRHITDRQSGAPAVPDGFSALEDLGGGLFAAANSEGKTGVIRVEYGKAHQVMPFEFQLVTWLGSPDTLVAVSSSLSGASTFRLANAQGRWLTGGAYFFDAQAAFYRDFIICRMASVPPKKTAGKTGASEPGFVMGVGVLDALGKTLVPFEHDRILPLFPPQSMDARELSQKQWRYDTKPLGFLAEKNGKLAVFSATGKRLCDYGVTRFSSPDAQGRMIVWSDNGRAAAVTLRENHVTLTGWSELFFTADALFAREKDSGRVLLFLLNANGGVDGTFTQARPMPDGNILVQSPDGLYGLLNRSGKEIVSCRYAHLFSTHNMAMEQPVAADETESPVLEAAGRYLAPVANADAPDFFKQAYLGIHPDGLAAWLLPSGPEYRMP